MILCDLSTRAYSHKDGELVIEMEITVIEMEKVLTVSPAVDVYHWMNYVHRCDSRRSYCMYNWMDSAYDCRHAASVPRSWRVRAVIPVGIVWYHFEIMCDCNRSYFVRSVVNMNASKTRLRHMNATEEN